MKSAIAPILALSLLCGAANAHIYNYIFGMNNHAMVPPTDSTARGSVRFDYNHHQYDYDLNLRIRGVALDDLLAAGPNGTPLHIYRAPRGQTGDIVLDPSYFGDFFQDGDDIRLIVENIRLGGNQGAFESNMFGNHHDLLDGFLYLQLFTKQYPNGEIRGQIPLWGRFLDTDNLEGFVGQDGPPSMIPAPAAPLLLAAGGLLATRRRREIPSNGSAI